MLVEFVLTMEDIIINGQPIDEVTIQWSSDINQQEILEISHQWITSQNFLTKRMTGLQRVGESSLIIEPLEEDIPDSHIPF